MGRIDIAPGLRCSLLGLWALAAASCDDTSRADRAEPDSQRQMEAAAPSQHSRAAELWQQIEKAERPPAGIAQRFASGVGVERQWLLKFAAGGASEASAFDATALAELEDIIQQHQPATRALRLQHSRKLRARMRQLKDDGALRQLQLQMFSGDAQRQIQAKAQRTFDGAPYFGGKHWRLPNPPTLAGFLHREMRACARTAKHAATSI